MTPDEAFTLLTRARNLDNKIGPVDMPRATVWAEELPDVSLKAALAALSRHYQDNPETFNIGHVRPLAKKVMAEWKGQKRAEESKRVALAAAERRAIEGPGPRLADVQMTDRELINWAAQRRAERAERNPEFAAAMEAANLAPSKPGALKISGSMGSSRDRGREAGSDALSGRAMPSRLGSLLGRVTDKIRGAE